MDRVQDISKLFYEIPADYKRIDAALGKERLGQRSLQEICEDVCGLLYDYKEGKLPYDQKSMADHMIKAFKCLINHGLDINNEDDECFNVMFEVFMFRIPHITPSILRYLIEQGGNPNLKTRYNGEETLFEYVCADIFMCDEVCEASIQCYLILLGYGGRFDDGKCPITFKNGKDISILRKFEDFEYEIDWESKELNRVKTLHVSDKKSKEEIFRV